MQTLKPQLLTIDRVFSVHSTNQTDANDSWRLPTSSTPPDNSFMTWQSPLDSSHHIWHLPTQKTEICQNILPAPHFALTRQNQDYTITLSPPKSAWLCPLKTVWLTPDSRPDDISISTSTKTPSTEIIATIQTTLHELQTAELADKQLHTDFDIYIKTTQCIIAQSKAKVQALDTSLTDVINSTASLIHAFDALRLKFDTRTTEVDSKLTNLDTTTTTLISTIAKTVKSIKDHHHQVHSPN